MKNKKVGLITFYKNNYGSMLQCYSTKHILESWGYTCDVIDEVPRQENKIKNSLKQKKQFITAFFKDPRFWFRWKKMHNKPFQLTEETLDEMNMFIRNEIQPLYYTENQLKCIANEYDAFIVGSDQVWNANYDIASIFFLDFVDNQKKIAFSISLGVDRTTRRFKKILCKGIRDFNEISVREESGERIVKSITNTKVVRVGDPTIMLSKENWETFCGACNVKKCNYVLLHFLDCPSELAIKYARMISSNKKVICIGYNYEDFENNHWDFISGGPHEYISYILGASYVLTDSFHTTLFSINFGKDFFVFERQYLHSNPQSGRIKDLLERYELVDRFIYSITQIPSSDVHEKQDIVKQERRVTKEYLMRKLDELNER
ncbi:polysaccharide pyruvyl transferase family protein [Butyrivibrio sp. AE2015]|uniref:polysaccharide pyruvyl transferase family protein n=1 Tax=Butyrivibrio sp. AE2015 TaxID=1280663 RepID=UPI0003B5C1A9|nr:polysaccharide pyruvyl transferase family protein [Butyrivibrio sp. AE2015]